MSALYHSSACVLVLVNLVSTIYHPAVCMSGYLLSAHVSHVPVPFHSRLSGYLLMWAMCHPQPVCLAKPAYLSHVPFHRLYVPPPAHVSHVRSTTPQPLCPATSSAPSLYVWLPAHVSHVPPTACMSGYRYLLMWAMYQPTACMSGYLLMPAT